MTKLLFSFILLTQLASCQTHVEQEVAEHQKDKNHIFFLHNKFIENNSLETIDPRYGKAEYEAILASFRADGFEVYSDKRAPNTDVILYARNIVTQIDSLIASGVEPSQITVIGTSKGGYIAQYVSTFAANPQLNFVFIGCYMDGDVEELPDIQFCGNILIIYEKTDPYGVSALKRKETSTLEIPRFQEIELNTGLNHGFLYKALDEWLAPCKQWARQQYTFELKK